MEQQEQQWWQQQHACQNGDYRHDDQQLDQREAGLATRAHDQGPKRRTRRAGPLPARSDHCRRIRPESPAAAGQRMSAWAAGSRAARRSRQTRRAPLETLLEWVVADSNQQRGEIVLLVSGDDSGPAEQVPADLLLKLLAKELPPRRAAAVVAELTGRKARSVYQELLAITGDAME